MPHPGRTRTAMTDLTYVRVEWDADVAVVTIDRQEKLNALNADVIRELGEVFASLRDDDEVRGLREQPPVCGFICPRPAIVAALQLAGAASFENGAESIDLTDHRGLDGHGLFSAKRML